MAMSVVFNHVCTCRSSKFNKFAQGGSVEFSLSFREHCFDETLLFKNSKLNLYVLAATGLSKSPARTSADTILEVRWNGRLMLRCKNAEVNNKMIGSRRGSSKLNKVALNEHVMIWMPVFRDIACMQLDIALFSVVPGHPMDNGPILGSVKLFGEALAALVGDCTSHCESKNEADEADADEFDEDVGAATRGGGGDDGGGGAGLDATDDSGTWLPLEMSDHLADDDQVLVQGKLLVSCRFEPFKEPANIPARRSVEECVHWNVCAALVSSSRSFTLPPIGNGSAIQKSYADCRTRCGGGLLRVRAEEACELVRTVNAFAEIWFNGREIGRTAVIASSMNPHWVDAACEASVPALMDLSDCCLEVRVFDKSRLGKITFLGAAAFTQDSLLVRETNDDDCDAAHLLTCTVLFTESAG